MQEITTIHCHVSISEWPFHSRQLEWRDWTFAGAWTVLRRRVTGFAAAQGHVCSFHWPGLVIPAVWNGSNGRDFWNRPAVKLCMHVMDGISEITVMGVDLLWNYVCMLEKTILNYWNLHLYRLIRLKFAFYKISVVEEHYTPIINCSQSYLSFLVKNNIPQSFSFPANWRWETSFI